MRRGLVGAVSALALAAGPAAQGPHAQDAPSVMQMAAAMHVLVLLSDGTVTGLVNNRSGQITGPQTPGLQRARAIPLPRKATAIAAGGDTSYAVLDDGTVAAWGRGYSGELGVRLANGPWRDTPALVPGLEQVVEVAADENAAVARLADGTLRVWGQHPAVVLGVKEAPVPGVFLPAPLRGVTDAVSIAFAGGVGLALRADGRVVAWGRNARGNLGLGTLTPEPQPPTEIPGLAEVVSIASLGYSSAAVTRDGRVWTWGDNVQAGLGDGVRSDTTDPPQPVPQPVKGVINAASVKAGTWGRHLIVRRRDGTLIGWGNTDWGQLGGGVSGREQATPTPIALPGVTDHWLGGNYSFARTTDGAIWFWGESEAAAVLTGKRANQRLPVTIPLAALRPPAP